MAPSSYSNHFYRKYNTDSINISFIYILTLKILIFLIYKKLLLAIVSYNTASPAGMPRLIP
jgi:uncharacterized protein with PQ loop repeat